MKKIIRITLVLTLALFASFSGLNSVKADNPNQCAAADGTSSGTIVSLRPGLKSGLILDELTGVVKEFHYAGLEVLEINVDYIYIVQITASGKIIIRDIHRR
jgi:hypothetical protein